MSSIKASLAKMGKVLGKGILHAMSAIITGVASILALLCLIIPESGWMKVAGFVASLVSGYLLTLGLAYMRGER